MKKILSLMMLLMAFTVNGFADTWTVAGSSAALNGTADWAPSNTANDMTDSGDGVNFTLVVTDCTLETGTEYAFKVVKNHSWDEAYPGSDYKFTVTETAIYTVTYTFNASTHDINVSTTKTGEAGVISHTYTVAGDETLFGTNWDAADTNNDMAETSTGVFTWTKSNVALDGSDIGFKICVDHAWGTSYPASNWVIDGSSVTAYTGSGNYNVTITFTESSKNITVSMVAVKTIDVGFINNMGWENVYVYTFDPSEQSGAWPGTKLTKDGTATVGIDPKKYDYYPYSFVATDPYPTQIIFNNGDTPGVEWSTKTGDLDLIESQAYTGPIYVVAGNDAAFGNWSAAASTAQLCDDGDGTYSLALSNLILNKDFEYKVAKKQYYGYNGDALAWYPSSNQTLGTAVNGKYNVEFHFDPSSSEWHYLDGTSATKTYEAVTIGATGWATTVTNSPLNFADLKGSFKAYTATVSGTEVTLNPVDDVQEETGLVLKGNEGTFYAPVAASSSTERGDLKHSSIYTFTVNDGGNDYYCYGLGLNTSGDAQFRKISDGVIIPAQKAFLTVSKSASANELTVSFGDGGATGINTLNAERTMMNGEMYNLAGQKVNKSFKGIVITNGRKVMMK